MTETERWLTGQADGVVVDWSCHRLVLGSLTDWVLIWMCLAFLLTVKQGFGYLMCGTLGMTDR